MAFTFSPMFLNFSFSKLFQSYCGQNRAKRDLLNHGKRNLRKLYNVENDAIDFDAVFCSRNLYAENRSFSKHLEGQKCSFYQGFAEQKNANIATLFQCAG